MQLAQKLVDAGRGQPTDLLRAQAQAETLRSALPRYRAEQEGAAYRLAVMLGKPPAALDVRSVACEHVPALKQPLPVGDGTALLKRRPDVRQAERELAAATAKIGVATADLFPQIRIGASAGFTGILDHLGQAPTAHWGWDRRSRGPFPPAARVRASTTWSSARKVHWRCLLYTSPSPRDGLLSRMPSSA